MKLTKERICVGSRRGEFGVGAIVVGDEWGPWVLYVGGDVCDALDEFDERHAHRVEVDDPALADYGGLEAAIDDGSIRINSGGTTVWVSDYEWLRTFASVRDAGRFWRGL